MGNRLLFWTGITGVVLFAAASLLGGFQFDHYDPISQYISETMATGTPYGKELRLFGYIPAGILLTVFAFMARPKFPKNDLIKIGFGILGLFYGVTTVLVGIFPCDEGCNKEFINPSISQIIHNLAGLSTYLFVPLGILLTGIGLAQSKAFGGLSKLALACGAFSMVCAGIFLSGLFPHAAGLWQRIIESTFIVWIIGCAAGIRRMGRAG